MEIILLGTGCPNVDPNRLGPSQLVVHPGATILIDCGSGVTQRMVAAGFTGRDLDAVFLTHLHSDHIVDLFQLISTSWQQGRDRPQKIFGPPGTKAYLEGLMELWRTELDLRKAHEARPSNVALDLEVTEFGSGEVWSQAGLTVEAVEVDHRPVRDAFGFVVSGSGERAVFSGDTTYCPALIQAARKADVLVHEVFIHREFKVIPGIRTAEGLANVQSYHTRSDVVGKVAAEAEVGGLILTHFVPTRFDKSALLEEVRRDFSGPLLIGEDLMRLDLTTGTLSHGGALLTLGSLWRSGARN